MFIVSNEDGTGRYVGALVDEPERLYMVLNVLEYPGQYTELYKVEYERFPYRFGEILRFNRAQKLNGSLPIPPYIASARAALKEAHNTGLMKIHMYEVHLAALNGYEKKLNEVCPIKPRDYRIISGQIQQRVRPMPCEKRVAGCTQDAGTLAELIERL